MHKVDMTYELYKKVLREARDECEAYVEIFEEIYDELHSRSNVILGAVQTELRKIIDDMNEILEILVPLTRDKIKSMSKEDVTKIYNKQRELIIDIISDQTHEVSD